MSVSDRHRIPVDGIAMRELIPTTVSVRVEQGAGVSKAVQHTSWMLCNLLCRLEGIVGALHFNIDETATLLAEVIPSGRPGANFRSEVVRCINDLGLIQITDGDGGVTVYAGPGRSPGLRALGSAWVGGVSADPFPTISESPLPFGPYIAACYTASEIFRSIALASFQPTRGAAYNAWAASPTTVGSIDGPPRLAMSLRPSSLAGVGAVGSAFLQTIWASDGIAAEIQAADSDTDGIDVTNLNRYCLFGRSDLGRPKASQAAAILHRAGLYIEPLSSAFESAAHAQDIIICAVDENKARAAVQNSYRPIMLMASTHGMRAEVIRCANPGQTACLRCYNPPDDATPDSDVRVAVEKLTDEQRAALARAAGVGASDVIDFISEERCGETSDAILATMKKQVNQPVRRFAIGFMSVLAGTLLAAETVKVELKSPHPLDARANRLAIQLVRPENNLEASPYARDPSCPACAASQALDIWRARLESLGEIS